MPAQSIDRFSTLLRPEELEVIFLAIAGVVESKNGFGSVTIYFKNRKLDNTETTVSLKPKAENEKEKKWDV